MLIVMRALRNKNQRGDTIVEVVVSIAILAFAMGGSYVLCNRALSTAVQGNQRKEATAIMQGQVELLRTAYKADPNFATDYHAASDYCMISSFPATPTPANNSVCTSYDSTQYRALVHWDNSNGDFHIVIYWDSITGRGTTVSNLAPTPAINQPNQSVINSYFRTPS